MKCTWQGVCLLFSRTKIHSSIFLSLSHTRIHHKCDSMTETCQDIKGHFYKATNLICAVEPRAEICCCAVISMVFMETSCDVTAALEQLFTYSILWWMPIYIFTNGHSFILNAHCVTLKFSKGINLFFKWMISIYCLYWPAIMISVCAKWLNVKRVSSPYNLLKKHRVQPARAWWWLHWGNGGPWSVSEITNVKEDEWSPLASFHTFLRSASLKKMF